MGGTMRSRVASGVCAVAMVAHSVAWAAQAEIPTNQLEIGPEIYYFKYKEPSLDVEFEGPMYGLAGSYTHHHANRLMLKADGRGAWGLVDYTGSGTLQNIQDWVLEGRLAAGYDLVVGPTWWVTPYVGVGYRYLNDDSSGRTTSTGAVGYERESNYFYSPIGVEVSTPLREGWRLGVAAEYDLFWTGEQHSHLEDADPSFNTVSNRQNKGYGVRGSVTLQKAGARMDVLIQPYIRWWSIQESESANITFSGVIIGTGFEPKNETLEVGGKVSVRF